MKKEDLSNEWIDKVTIITDAKDLKSSALNSIGFSVPKNEKFQVLGVVEVQQNGDIQPFQAVMVKIESNQKQLPVSSRVFQGTYFEVVKKDGQPVIDTDGKIKTQMKQIDTPFRKSGLNLIEFCEKFKENTFVATNPIQYESLQFGTDSTIRPKSIMTYKQV